MLRTLSATVAALVMSLAILVCVGSTAYSDCTANPETGQVDCEASGEGDTNGDGTEAASTCHYLGSEISCTGPNGSVWNSAHGCWVAGTYDGIPPPGKSNDDGAWYVCFWPPPGASWDPVWIDSNTATINPIDLAHRAIASMDLDPISIGIVPEPGLNRVGLIGMPVWMWAAQPTERNWGPITRSASQGTVSVRAAAKVSWVVWDMGDGHQVTCAGPGTPYADGYGSVASPTCGHHYDTTSSGHPDGSFRISATSRWVVEWDGGGQSGTIEVDLTTDQLAIRIGEAQVLTQ